MKIKVSIVVDVNPAIYAKSAGIPRTDVREHVKQGVIDAYLNGVGDDEPDGITGWSWS